MRAPKSKSTPSPRRVTAPIRYRRPRVTDASRVRDLVAASPPLELNSAYAYLLLCTHFAATSAVAEVGGRLVGFAAGYLKPADPEVLFVWQIGVARAARGRAVGLDLLRTVLGRPAARHVRHVEATVTPDNAASLALFQSLARHSRTRCRRTPLFTRRHFGATTHDDEQLLRIGPLRGSGVSR